MRISAILLALALAQALALAPALPPAVRWATAQGAGIGLDAAPELVDSGLMRYLLPRFSLKTSVRVTLAEDGAIRLADAPPGTPVFARGDRVYYLSHDGSPQAQRFADWLTSEIGRRTVESFRPEAAPAFTAIAAVAEDTAAVFAGDAARGAELSHRLCGRCHVVSEKNRMKGLGSTPSFAALRTLPNWQERFETFFTRNPHGAFTQVAEVTQAFDPSRPSPISALEITVDDLEAIIAYAASLEPADLGAPIRSQ